MVRKEIWQGRDWGGLGLSYVVGFGTGQAVQGRWSSSGKYFAIAETASLLSMISHTNSIADTSKTFATGLIFFGVSRIWEIIDVIVFASRSEVPKEK